MSIEEEYRGKVLFIHLTQVFYYKSHDMFVVVLEEAKVSALTSEFMREV
jgi:hypothetical protein